MRTVLAWFGGIFLVAGLGLFYGGLQEATKERAYRTEGQVVDAVVVGKSVKRASLDGNPSTRYEIAYRFTTADGRSAEGVDVVSVEEWERLEPGSPFKVTYVPGAPGSSRAVGSGGMTSSLVMTGLGGLLALLGGLALGWTARRLWTERRLLRGGTPGQGTVLSIEPSNVSVNRVRQWNLQYRYADHLGRSHEGRSGPVPPEEAHAVRVGDTVEVRFDRARPERSIWVRPAELPGRPLRPSVGTKLRNIVATVAVLIVALIVGESIPALKGLDRLAARHEFALTAVTVALTALGFLLFMGGVLYRIFGGDSDPIPRGEIEDLSRNVGIDAPPATARVSAYRVRGRTAGASFSDQFTLRQAKEAWRRRAWRTSARWRANFIVTAGALLFTVGLFGFFVIGGPAGIKLLFVTAVVYVTMRIATELARS